MTIKHFCGFTVHYKGRMPTMVEATAIVGWENDGQKWSMYVCKDCCDELLDKLRKDGIKINYIHQRKEHGKVWSVS